MADISIREATLDDRDAIAAVFLDELMHHVGLMPDRFRVPAHILPDDWLEGQLDDDTHRLFLAEQHGTVVGQILIRIEESKSDLLIPRKYVYINEIVVLRAYRGQGVGQAMMQYVEGWAAALGITELELNVWECNKGAIRFYERLGYGTLSRRMIKTL